MEASFADRMSTGPAFALCFLAYQLMATAMGYGAALLLLPKDLKRDALAFAPVFGFCVLVFGGWHFMFLGPPGTDRYWHWLVLIGVALTAAGCAVHRRLVRETFHRDAGLLALAAMVGVCFFASPLTRQPRLTAISQGNSDVAHYTAVERLVQEHRGDVMGGPEDQFSLGYPLRYTVTGAYLGTAVLGSALRVPLYQLQLPSLAVYQHWGALLAGLFALRVLRFRRTGAVLVAVISGTAGLTLFTAWNVFISQFAAVAMTLALFTLLLSAFGAPEPPENPWRRLPAAVALGLGLTLTYPHMVLLVWGVLGAVAGVHALARRSLKQVGQVIGVVAGALAGMAALSPERARTMVDYLFAMGKVEAGFYRPWVHPLTFVGLSSEGLFDEEPRTTWVLALLALGLGALVGWGFWRAWRTERSPLITSAALLGVVGFGYLVLCLGGTVNGVPGGYKAYKLLTFFYPLVLGAALLALRELAPGVVTWSGRASLGVALALVAGVAVESAARVRAMRVTRYVVKPDLVDLGRLETDPRVESINIVTDEWWFKLWETAFLLKKPLYQRDASYYPKSERLKGQWTLEALFEPPDDVLEQPQRSPEERLPVNDSYTLARTATLVRTTFGTGWHAAESDHRWTGEQRVTVMVDTYVPRRATLAMQYTHLTPGTTFDVLLGDRVVGSCLAPQSCEVGPFELAEGTNALELAASTRPVNPGPQDPRHLGIAFRKIQLTPVTAP